jgi:hypothetical protein
VLGYLLAAGFTLFATAGEFATVVVYVRAGSPSNEAKYTLLAVLGIGAIIIAVYVLRTMRQTLLDHTVARAPAATAAKQPSQGTDPTASGQTTEPEVKARRSARAYARLHAHLDACDRAKLAVDRQLPRKVSIGRRSATL